MTAIDDSRRRFIRDLAVGTTVLAGGLSLAGCDSDDAVQVRFDHGVASGDPLADRVILWTRATPSRAQAVDIDWEIALDEKFTRPAGAGRTRTGAEQDYTVKIDAGSLLPDTVYYYRFSHGSTRSPVGRTRTLPVGTVSEARLAVFSCANFPAGYFHVYAETAKRDDLHAVVHLGDYIYEYDRDGYASQDAARLGRLSEPAHELLSLDDYRRRYAQYRSDRDLQALHAKLPFICVWDDHEIANDTWSGGADNHDPATEGDFAARRAAALTAYHEWLPIRAPEPNRPERIFRSFDFGNLLSLHMLDIRVIARDRQLDYADYLDPASGTLDSTRFLAELTAPTRQLLGAEQTAWLQGQMAASQATWQVLGQQVLMGRMNIPAPLVTFQISFGEYAALLQKAALHPETLTAEEQALLAQPAIPYNLDAWDGYFVARETVLGTARALDKNLVVLSGDTHNAWASDLNDMHDNPVGVEFATSSVSSPGLEEYFPAEDPDAVAAGLTQLIEPLKYADTKRRGYMTVTFTPGEARAEWRYVSTVKETAYRPLNERTKALKVLPGKGNRRLRDV